MKSISLNELCTLVKSENAIKGGANRYESTQISTLKKELMFNTYGTYGIRKAAGKLPYDLYIDSLKNIFGVKMILRLLNENEKRYKDELRTGKTYLFNARNIY